MASETQTTTYNDIVLNDIVAGQDRLGTDRNDVALEMSGRQGPTRACQHGPRLRMSDVDLPAMARLYECAKSDTGSTPHAKIYGAFSIENVEIADSRLASRSRFGRVLAAGISWLVRPRDSLEWQP